jgi:16S rRNA (adenine1518-N6/adenine1519-N6)-dimethyltransferase
VFILLWTERFVFDMRPKKYLGQHFLTAPAVAKKIADAVPASADEYVLEIGPGRGALSVHLIERFPNLHLVEVDTDAVNILREKLGFGTYTIHNEDVMAFDFSLAGFPLHVVGNLPYNIGAMIIRKTLALAPSVLSCTFMVQREVAARIVSAPHSRENGFLSIFCQFFGEAKMLFNVPPGAFFPRPNVDSSVFQVIVDRDVEKKLPRASWENFFSFVSDGFSMRRKQLAKILALKLGRDKEYYGNTLLEMGMDAAARPEDLDVNGWLDLYKRVGQQRNEPY